MCSISVIFDYGRKFPLDFWTEDSLAEYKRLLKAAENFDKAADQPDCVDPKKAEWLADVENRVEKREEEK